MYKLDLEKQRNQRSNGLHSLDHIENNGIPEKRLLLFHIEYVKAFDYVDQEATIRTRRGTTGSKLGKEYDKAVYCHPVCLTYMQSTSCEMLGWLNHKLESRLLGEISTTSDKQMISL